MYRRVKQTGLSGSAVVAELFNVPESDCNFVAFDAGQAFKRTIPRPIVAGHVGDPDVYGAQQHALLLHVDIPLDVQLDWARESPRGGQPASSVARSRPQRAISSSWYSNHTVW